MRDALSLARSSSAAAGRFRHDETDGDGDNARGWKAGGKGDASGSIGNPMIEMHTSLRREIECCTNIIVSK